MYVFDATYQPPCIFTSNSSILHISLYLFIYLSLISSLVGLLTSSTAKGVVSLPHTLCAGIRSKPSRKKEHTYTVAQQNMTEQIKRESEALGKVGELGSDACETACRSENDITNHNTNWRVWSIVLLCF